MLKYQIRYSFKNPILNIYFLINVTIYSLFHQQHYKCNSSNNQMITVQKYFNSSKTLQENSLAFLKKNVSLAPSRQLVKNFNAPKKMHRTLQKRRQDQPLLNKNKRKSYQHMIKAIRTSDKEQNYKRSIMRVKEGNRAAYFLKLNIERSKLGVESRLRDSIQKKSDNSENIQQKCEISQNAMPKIPSLQYYQNQRYRYSRKIMEIQKNTNESKPKITILSKIINAMNLKLVKQTANLSQQNTNEVSLALKKNSFQLKCSREALQRIKSVYESRQKQNKNQGVKFVLKKPTKSPPLYKQHFDGWTISQFFQQQQKFQIF